MERAASQIRFQYLEKKTAIFFAGAVVLIALFFAATAYRHDYFTRVTELYLFSDNATGIKRGMAVKILGFDIGAVKDITIEPNAKVKVKIAVRSDYMRFITLDSRARLFKEGMIGESVIEITPGNQELRQLAHNAVLPFDRGRDLTELADELYRETKPILTGIGQTVATINNPEGDVQQSLHQVNQTSRNIESLTRDLAVKLPPILDNAASATKTAKDNLPIMAKTVNDNLPGMIDSSKKSLDNIRDATADVKQMTSASAQELPRVLHDGQALVNGSLSIVNGVKESWPVRNMIAAPQEQSLQLDSYVAPAPAR